MNTLTNCIQQEAKAMIALIGALQEEQTLLTKAPSLDLMEQISEMTAKKNQLVTAISVAGQQRGKELSRLGYKATTSTMPEWLQDNEQMECWRDLVAQTKKANELNRINGILINRHLVRNQNTLQVLQKNLHANQDEALYGADGQSNTQRNNGRGVVV